MLLEHLFLTPAKRFRPLSDAGAISHAALKAVSGGGAGPPPREPFLPAGEAGAPAFGPVLLAVALIEVRGGRGRIDSTI